jgi:hypothetical protein
MKRSTTCEEVYWSETDISKGIHWEEFTTEPNGGVSMRTYRKEGHTITLRPYDIRPYTENS